jgi:hypothetical protein
MDTDRLNSSDRLAGEATFYRVALTRHNYQLKFDLWSKCNKCAAADLVRGSGRRIWGVIYQIPDDLIRRETAGDRKSLDEIEGEGGNYERTAIDLYLRNGRPVSQTVITYIGRKSARKRKIPTSSDYVRHIFTGLDNYDLPDGYVAYVKNRVLANNRDLRSALTICAS